MAKNSKTKSSGDKKKSNAVRKKWGDGVVGKVKKKVIQKIVKNNKKNDEKKRGRPQKITAEELRKLEYAFSIWCSDLEACLYAKISKTTLYEYQSKNSEFTERKEMLKEQPVLTARETVVKSLKKSPDMAMKYLERKKKDEFSVRSEHTGKEWGPINVTKVIREDA